MGKRPRTLRIPCKAPGCLTPKIKRGYCDRHYQQWLHKRDIVPPMTDKQKFWAKVTIREPDQCWPWNKALSHGYGLIADPSGGTARAHRVAYEYAVGPIPAGKILDHICHDPDLCQLGDDCPHRRCCNPKHLKPVTNLENSAPHRAAHDRGLRVSACPRGHAYTPDNTRTDVRGGRHCRTCERARYT